LAFLGSFVPSEYQNQYHRPLCIPSASLETEVVEQTTAPRLVSIQEVVEGIVAVHKTAVAHVDVAVADPVGVSTWVEAVDRPTRLVVLSRFLSLLARYWNALFVAVAAVVAAVVDAVQARVSLVVAVDDSN
jgi:hypothetical protein